MVGGERETETERDRARGRDRDTERGQIQRHRKQITHGSENDKTAV